eukprot:1161381-Pelagomonas_calceolata.AAC.3
MPTTHATALQQPKKVERKGSLTKLGHLVVPHHLQLPSLVVHLKPEHDRKGEGVNMLNLHE